MGYKLRFESFKNYDISNLKLLLLNLRNNNLNNWKLHVKPKTLDLTTLRTTKSYHVLAFIVNFMLLFRLNFLVTPIFATDDGEQGLKIKQLLFDLTFKKRKIQFQSKNPALSRFTAS